MFFLTAVVREGHCIQNELAYVILIQPTELHSVLSNFLEQCPPWEANSQSASEEIPHTLWNPQVHYHVHKSPSLVPVLSQMHPVHTLPTYFPKIQTNIVLPFMPQSSKWSLPFRFSTQNIVCISHLSHPCYMPLPFHPPWWRVQGMNLLIMQSFQASHPSLPK